MVDDLAITIAADDLPRPGEITKHQLGENLVAFIEHTGEPTEDVVEPTEEELDQASEPLISYEVVDVRGATRTHAAIVRHRDKRSVVNRWTLCSISNSRRVIGRRRDQDLSTVTCTRCRRRLMDEGEL
jgi:hypothetical protein